MSGIGTNEGSLSSVPAVFHERVLGCDTKKRHDPGGYLINVSDESVKRKMGRDHRTEQ